MGNCFKASTHDDISLLRDSDLPDNGESSAPVLPPPPYQVSVVNYDKFNVNVYEAEHILDTEICYCSLLHNHLLN